MEEKVKERLAPGYLEDDTVGHLVEYLEGEKPMDF